MHDKQHVNILPWLARVGLLGLLTLGATPVKANIRDKQDGRTSALADQYTAADAHNQPPVAVDDSGPGFVTFNHRPFITGSVLANDYDPDGDPLYIKSFNVSVAKGQIQYLYPGSLDTSFGLNGKVTTKFGSSEMGEDLLLQAGGRFVVVGTAFLDAIGMSFALARYNPDGSLDESFGAHGKVTTGFADGGAAFGAAMQSNGKIIAAGCGNQQFALARYNADGSLDQSFGAGEQVLTGFAANSSDCAYSVAIQTDGKIVAAGTSEDSSTSKFALARYNSNGSLDTTFGTQGKVTTHFTANSIDEGSAVVIQPDGKILVVGDSDANLAVVRYNKNGTLDTNFGTSGKITLDTNHETVGPTIALQADDRILVAATSTGGILYIARYNLDGNPDITFGTNGLATTVFSGCVGGSNPGLLASSDGKIIVAAACNQDASVPFTIVRYTSNGSLDGTFGMGGIVTTYFTGIGAPHGIAMQPDGKLIVAGQSDDGFSVARYLKGGTFFYNPNGQFDSLPLGQTAYDSYTYVVSDGVLTDTATVSITVEGGTSVFLPVVEKQ